MAMAQTQARWKVGSRDNSVCVCEESFIEQHNKATTGFSLTTSRRLRIYLAARGCAQEDIGYAWSLYWTKEHHIRLGPLTGGAAHDLLEICIHRFGLARLELEGFREEVLRLSGHLPGSIVKMCELAANPRYHYGDQIKIKLVHVDYLIRTSPSDIQHSPNCPK